MATGKKYGAYHGNTHTYYRVEGSLLVITAFPIGQEIEPPVDQVTTMRVINTEIGLRMGAGTARKHKRDAMKESDRHAAIEATLAQLAEDKAEESAKQKEAARVAEHKRDYVAEEIWGHAFSVLSDPAKAAIDEIIKLRAEVTEMGK